MKQRAVLQFEVDCYLINGMFFLAHNFPKRLSIRQK
jgi:hypothetical protein